MERLGKMLDKLPSQLILTPENLNQIFDDTLNLLRALTNYKSNFFNHPVFKASEEELHLLLSKICDDYKLVISKYTIAEETLKNLAEKYELLEIEKTSLETKFSATGYENLQLNTEKDKLNKENRELLMLLRGEEHKRANLVQTADELKTREKYLIAAEKDLQLRLHQLTNQTIELNKWESALKGKETIVGAALEATAYMDEIEFEQMKITLEVVKTKIKQAVVSAPRVPSGIENLDYILVGGYPRGTNTKIEDEDYTGGHVFLYSFIRASLNLDIPCLYITTNRSADTIRKELINIFPGFIEKEKQGLIYWIDLHSAKSLSSPFEGHKTENKFYLKLPIIEADTQNLMSAIVGQITIFKNNFSHTPYHVAVDRASAFSNEFARRILINLRDIVEEQNAVGVYLVKKKDKVNMPEMNATIKLTAEAQDYKIQINCNYPIADKKRLINTSYLWSDTDIKVLPAKELVR